MEAFFPPLVVISLAIPDPVYIILAILVLGTEESSRLIAMTIALVPFVVNIVVAGVHARDVGLDEMSGAYRFGAKRYLVDVIGYQIAPALLAAARTSFAFSWMPSCSWKRCRNRRGSALRLTTRSVCCALQT